MSRRRILDALPTRPSVELPETLPEFPQDEEPAALFARRLETVGGTLITQAGSGRLAATLAALAEEFGGGPVLWETGALIEQLRLGPDPGHSGWALTDLKPGAAVSRLEGRPVAADRQVAAGASVSVARAEWGIAETGSVVECAGAGRGRALAVLPPAHIAVLASDRLLATTADFYARPAPEGSVAVVVTGPSRTADIEKKLILGVHGPRFMGVVLV